ncbi:hypothetical protein [Lactobacillus gallinarum]|uniref:hypothetical protein n=1 Tax=Lactobacillus gallinarum TaxID=52242 RepID=UPI0024BB0E7E|nr:hypothetical protein [Lactobacillus gallinarum]
MVLLTGKGEEMLYPYIELLDETIVTHSEIKPDNTVLINFEQSIENGFREARITLPSYKWLYNEWFSNEQIASFEDFVHKNSAVIYKYARLGGIDNSN